MAKDPGAFLTIGEVSEKLGVAQHILRYWETKFYQLRPLQRAGNRRYYRPDDVALAATINRLLNEEGYTVKGAVKALKDGTVEPAAPAETPAPAIDVAALKSIRDRLAAAIS
ncbi:MerR family transcriptional regulator [Sphingomicrobium clamense]|uniref:MerR family transcriptional regulator n=1 Tax=Sphingomicrobium clamense TaxID=2851013 RepID=A0ABS6V920_9SPHN|nr:MerR family transcriptional regulator [Sphingomicrobium sp. B8]MBW0145850.1 MerR family transcriptional regulator [Sphingomicrobium sp. B8]